MIDAPGPQSAAHRLRSTQGQQTGNRKEETVIDMANKDERIWAALCHISAFAIYIIPLVGNILAPLGIWLLKKNQYPLVRDQGKEVLNFQISLTIYLLTTYLLLVLLLSFVFIGMTIIFGLLIFQFVIIIYAALRANDGESYRYPITIRLIK
jgi:hypothetical protein